MSDGEQESCDEFYKKLNNPIESSGCTGPAGLNKSLMVIGDINITLGMIVAIGITYYYCTKILNKCPPPRNKA